MGKRVKHKAAVHDFHDDRKPRQSGTRKSKSSKQFNLAEMKAYIAEMIGEEEANAFEAFINKREHENEIKKQESQSVSWTLEEKPSYKHRTYHETVSTEYHSCNGHHCYHTRPPQIGSTGFCYDSGGETCCHCGSSPPNPYENERR